MNKRTTLKWVGKTREVEDLLGSIFVATSRCKCYSANCPTCRAHFNVERARDEARRARENLSRQL